MKVPSALAVLLLSFLAACSHTGAFVWIEDFPLPAEPPSYVIAAGDTLNVRVWNQEGMSAHARVRDDGKISLPFLNDVVAEGYTPNVLSSQLQTRLKDFINTPVVTVSLEQRRPVTVSVAGEVIRPGIFILEPGAGVLHALVSAGGLTQYADELRIFVVRPKPAARIRFTYPSLTRSAGKASSFRLQPGDAIVVE